VHDEVKLTGSITRGPYLKTLFVNQPLNKGCLMELLQQNDDTLKTDNLTSGNTVATVEVV